MPRTDHRAEFGIGMTRQANAIDFWRGFALVTIFINHIPGVFYERLTYRNLSISDSAELFVFLAGWSLGLLVVSGREPVTAPRLVARLGGRALTIYAAQILISSLALAMLAAAAYSFDNPLILEWHNAAAVFQDPALAHIGLVLLTHQLGYFDILPLYVVLMLAAPLIALIDRFAWPLLVPLSLTLYLSSLIVPFTAPTWPVPGQWFFNPFAWQVIFVLGFALSRDEGLGAVVRRNMQIDTDRRNADRADHGRAGVVQLVPGPDQAAGAEAPFPQRKKLPDADAADSVPGAGGGLFRLLRVLRALGALAHGVSLLPRPQLAQRVLRRIAVEPDWANRSLPLHGLAAY